MNKLSGFAILLFAVLLLSVSSVTVKKASAISFTTGPCPKGEARDYMGICWPVQDCKASLFAAAGTCKVIEGNVQQQCAAGTCKVTITAPNYGPKSPILGGENEHSLKNLVNATKNWLEAHAHSCKNGCAL
jgi:hypothetical protein